MKNRQLYLQLYSLRRETAVDAEATLRAVPSLGFDGVEMAGDYGWSGQKWVRLLAELRLEMVSAHVSLQSLESDFARVVEFHRALGHGSLVVPALPEEMRTAPGFAEAARRLNDLARALHAEGFSLRYHHHAFEFARLENGARGIDILLVGTEPSVQFEFDTFWIERGGENASRFLETHAERTALLHAKDFRHRDNLEVPAGTGDVDFTTIIPLALGRGWPVILEYESEPARDGVRQGGRFLRTLIEA